MSNNLNYTNMDLIDQKVTIQMIMIGIVLTVLILTLVSFIHIYSTKKEQIIKDMEIESSQLETIINDNLNYSLYFLNIVGKHIKEDHENLHHILRIISDYSILEEFDSFFGWKSYSWIDKNFLEIVTNTDGIITKPKQVNYIENTIDINKIDDDNLQNKIIFYNENAETGNNIKIINNIYNELNNEYIGSVVLNYDINTMVKSLNSRKKNKSTNFIILDKNFQIVAQSKDSIKNLIDQDSELLKRLSNFRNNLALYNENNHLSYLDMINGLNYFVSSLKSVPFILIVNIDNDIIRKDIINDIAKNFISVCIFASISLFAIIFIYKRETFLREKAEKAYFLAESATKAKTKFLAFTAHEIRSPLSFITTGSEVMITELMGKISPTYKKYAEGIYYNSMVILDFINDILDETQIIESKFKIVNDLYDVEAIINETVQGNLARFNNRKVEIQTFIENKLPLLVCDRRRIVQVFNNLISNSIKYSNDNTTIEIKVKIQDGEMKITITDQGFGMKEYEIPIALSPYGTLRDQQDYYSTRSYGLGLTIVKMLLDAHEAELNINSVEGKGTTVKITFPKYKLIYNNNKPD